MEGGAVVIGGMNDSQHNLFTLNPHPKTGLQMKQLDLIDL